MPECFLSASLHNKLASPPERRKTHQAGKNNHHCSGGYRVKLYSQVNPTNVCPVFNARRCHVIVAIEEDRYSVCSSCFTILFIRRINKI